MKVIQLIKSLFLGLILQQSVLGQEVKKEVKPEEKKYTIENCVNHFELDKAKKK